MNLKELDEELKKLEVDNRGFSLLPAEGPLPDRINLILSGSYYCVFYLDERGNKNYESTLHDFDSAAKYLLALIDFLNE